MMPNCDASDRFVFPYLTLTVDSYFAHLRVPKLELIELYFRKYAANASAILKSRRI